MRPNATHDPAVEFVEECSNVGAFVVLGPSPQGRIQFLDQLRGLSWSTASREHPHPIPEASNRFPRRIRDPPLWVPSLNHAVGKLSPALRSHNPVSQKIKSLLGMNDPRLLWIQSHAHLFQYPSRSCQCRSRLRRRLAGDHPIIGEPCQSISFASHLPIERRQKNVTEQRRSDSALWGPALAGKEFPLSVASSLKHCLDQA